MRLLGARWWGALLSSAPRLLFPFLFSLDSTESTCTPSGGINGRALAASDTASVEVPSFETLLELDGYLTGCYNGYRAELHAFDLTFEDFKPIIEARGEMVL